MSELRVLVGTKDYAGTVGFYRDVLGFPVHEVWDDPDGRGTLLRAADSALIEVIEDSPDHPALAPHGVTVSIEVPDVDVRHRRLAEAGATITEPLGDRPWGHRAVGFRDPNGLDLVLFTVTAGDHGMWAA
ncbi:MAG: VOC family protein [Gaiella sp.]|nr:VOC family protein [Gaiella sp.]